MQRLLTAAFGTPLIIAAIFLLPSDWFFGLAVLIVDWAALEYLRIARTWAPDAPLRWLLVLVPAAALGLLLATGPGVAAAFPLWGAGLLLTVGIGILLLLAGTPPAQALPALGAFTFGIPYFALGAVALARLQEIDPWLVFLGFALVFLGDTAAYYVGSAIGRRKMAPVVSPNKSWEGAIANFVTALIVAAVWSWWRLGGVPWELLAVAAATAVAAQFGDLVESLLKRGAGIKDSGTLLPGHGGMLDRIDALLLALPVLLAGIWLVGPERLVPLP